MVPREPHFFGSVETSHSGPWDYLQRVPLVFYGPGFIRSQGEISPDTEVTVADLAPTLADLLDLEWPDDRAGRAIPEVLVPADDRPGDPKVIVVIAWDGGGWNVLEQWPQSWPFLRKLMERGTSVRNAIVGSSPSVTPTIHATIGTGTFPRQHGIIDIPVRDGDKIVGSYDGRTPKYLRVPTLADLHDASVDNAAKVGIFSYKAWHWGMMGHGAYIDGGDKDIAVLAERTAGNLLTNERWYSLPSYLHDVPGFEEDLRAVDSEDGKLDGAWMGHDVLHDPAARRETPVWVRYQTRLIEALLEEERFGEDDVPDLFFTNYKQIDEIGHSFNMVNPETREIIAHTDEALSRLVSFLDRKVGKRRWVLAVTADHGMTPDPSTTGAWALRMERMKEDLGDHFEVDPEELLTEHRVTGLWFDKDVLRQEGITVAQIANFLLGYTIGENSPYEEIPREYRDRVDETVFDAAFPSKRLNEVWRCATRKG